MRRVKKRVLDKFEISTRVLIIRTYLLKLGEILTEYPNLTKVDFSCETCVSLNEFSSKQIVLSCIIE